MNGLTCCIPFMNKGADNLHDLDSKIKILMSHDFLKLERPYAYYTETGYYSLEYLSETDVRVLRRTFTLLYGISNLVDHASQELIDVFGEEKAKLLETVGLKKFDRSMILRKGVYLLSEEYIRETPLSKLIDDLQMISQDITNRYADNVLICKHHNELTAMSEDEFIDRTVNLAIGLIGSSLISKPILKALVKSNMKKLGICDYENYDEALSIIESKLKP